MPDTATRGDRLAALHQRLTDQVRQLRTGEDWQRWLRVASRFHNYSFQNSVAILATRPDATRVAGYRAWQDLGRQVNKGERGIPILAPILRRGPTPDSTTSQDDDTTPTPRLVGYRIAYVWDVTQTSGQPLPEPPHPALLEGHAPDGLWDSLASLVTGAGFTLDRGACNGANGTTDFAVRTVRVRDDVDDAQAVKTLAHELGHVLLHDPTGRDLPFVCRGIAEVEAESVAYLVATSHGLPTDAYTFPYVATWATDTGSQQPEDVVTATGQRVLQAAGRILTHTQDATSAPDHAAHLAAHAETVLDRTQALASGERTATQRAQLLAVHTDAAAYFETQVMAGWVPGYLRERRLAAVLDPASPWRLGYAPAQWTGLTDHLRTAGYSDHTIETSGLATRARTGRLVDRFRDRLMLPIRDVDGHVIAFIGRAAPAADSRAPKYLNSPETPLYRKSDAVFGLAETRLFWQSGATPVLVEGPLDAIAVDLASHGQHCGLAPCGTALAPTQAHAVLDASRPSGQLTVALDGDDAGRAAAARAFPFLNVSDVEVSVAELEPGADPALLLQRDGRDGLHDALLRTRPLDDLVVDRQIGGHADRLGWPEGRLAAARAAVPTIALLPPAQALRQVKRVADRVGLPVPTVTDELAAHLARDQSPRGAPTSRPEHARTRTPTALPAQRRVVHSAHR
jgi:DNA primase catalytic core